MIEFHHTVIIAIVLFITALSLIAICHHEYRTFTWHVVCYIPSYWANTNNSSTKQGWQSLPFLLRRSYVSSQARDLVMMTWESAAIIADVYMIKNKQVNGDIFVTDQHS